MRDAMRMVVGVIGHVDHGKTALVRALTGMETDRLAEEKRRGISIALGFAHMTVGGAVIDFIDMPGHERFVRTMVSGATGVDVALLVVAANEGIKPQTVEHLDIASLLGLRRVILAVSKADLVDPAQAASATAAALALVGEMGFALYGSVLTSATTGAGLDALRAALAGAVPSGPPAGESGFPYLPIDRVFSIPGHGTVVTGTLRRGALAVSDPVALAPGGPAIRLRGLQVHGARAGSALPGQRVAANLRDIEPAQIARGAALTAPGMLPPSRWLAVSLRAVGGAPPLPTLSRLMLLFGTEEVEIRLRLLDCDALPPGQTALAQLRCALPVAVPARERFILRRPSPSQTIAGGLVIDPAAVRLRRHAPGVISRLAGLMADDPVGIMRAELQAVGPLGAALTRLSQLAGLSEGRVVAGLQTLPVMLGRSRVAVLQPEFDRTVAAIAAVLADHDGDLAVDRLAALLPWAGRPVIEDSVAELARRGALVRSGGAVGLHRPQREQERTTADAVRAAALAEILRRAGLKPPDIWTVANCPQSKRLLDRLVREGVVVRAVDKVQKRELLFHRDAVEAAKRQLRSVLSDGNGMLVGEAGTALGISRKYCVPLLEHLDTIGFTRRIADRRVLRQS